MNVFDLIVLVILAALTIRGVLKGMVSQIVSVGSLFVCWIVASRFAFVIAPSIPAEEPWNNIGAMVVLFVVTMIAIRFVHSVVEKWIRNWKLEKLNRSLGGVLGFVKALLICMVLTFFCVMLSEKSREVVFQSKSGHRLASLIARTGAFIPKDSCELLRAQIDLFNAKVNGTSLEDESDPSTDERSLFAFSGDSVSGDSVSENESTLSQGVSRIENLLSQGNSFLQEARELHGEIEEKKSGAVSFFDAVSRWWNGEASKEVEADEALAAEKTTSRPELTPEDPSPRSATMGVLFRESSVVDNAAPTSSSRKTDTPYVPLQQTLVQQPPVSPPSGYEEENMFLNRTLPTPSTADTELKNLLPASSQTSIPANSPAQATGYMPPPIDPNLFSDQPVVSQAMAVPRSSAPFRLRNSSADPARSDRLLHLPPSTENSSGVRATVFSGSGR